MRYTSGCTPGVVVEHWRGKESRHVPAYDSAFTDALTAWLLAQR